MIKKTKNKLGENKIIVAAVMTFILLGFVSAGFITHFGKITGKVSVSAPIFYLDGPAEDGGAYHNLYIDEIPTDQDIYFWDGNRLVFKTGSLNVSEFYKARFDATIYLKSNHSNNTVQARILKLDENNIEKTICYVDEPITIQKDVFRAETFSCESSSAIDMSRYDILAIEIRGNGDANQDYWIKTGGDSKIEISAI
jgi:hypothetical protein